MKNIKIIFVLILLQNIQDACSDGYIATWSPKVAQEGGSYSFVLVSNSMSRTKATIKLGSKKVHTTLEDGQHVKVDFDLPNLNRRDAFNATITYYLYSSEKCLTKEIEIKPKPKYLYGLIQTDKPVYKPGDDMKFRVIVVDNELKPWHMNNIEVKILDPLNRTVHVLDELEDPSFGVFEDMIKLADDAVLGNWKIEVIVDRNPMILEVQSKIFEVKKYILPEFAVNILTDEQHVLQDSNVTISFYAEYSFGKFVTGNAELKIQNPQTGKIYFTKMFNNIQEVKEVTYNVEKDFELKASELEAVVTFTEPVSNKIYNKSTTFYVHKTDNDIVDVIHPKTFIPGSIFTIIIKLKNWKGEKSMKILDFVHVSHSFYGPYIQLFNNKEKIQVRNGVAKYELKIPNEVNYIKLNVKHNDRNVYDKYIQIGTVDEGVNALDVEFWPKSPQLNDVIKVTVKSVLHINNLLAIVMNKLGIIETKAVTCSSYSCEFSLKITKKMIRHSTLTVFQVHDGQHIYRGSTKIIADDIGSDKFSMSIPKSSARTNEDIEINFDAPSDSKVFLLAFDKRLTYLREGNDIKREDLIKKVGNYDSKYKINIVHESLFKDCTPDELSFVEKPIRMAWSSGSSDSNMHLAVPHRSSLQLYLVRRNFDRISSTETKEINIEDTDENESEFHGEMSQKLREIFPETWIFDSFTMPQNGTEVKTFKTPDSITSWDISAFCVKKDIPIAIAPAKELIINNEFFVKLNLPYSIRYKEVLQLDIMVHNYIKPNKKLNVKVELQNLNNGQEFQFVEVSRNSDKCFINNKINSLQSISIPSMSVKKVTFHIRSNPNVVEFEEKLPKKIRLKVRATGVDEKGKTYNDLLLKHLRVEPVGIKTFHVNTQTHLLDGSETKSNRIYFNLNNFVGIDVIVSGDHLTDALHTGLMFDSTPSNGLDQKVVKLKKNAEYYRYLTSKKTEPTRTHLTEDYESLLKEKSKDWSYVNTSIFQAFFIDTVASAMELSSIKPDQEFVRKELDKLKRLRNIEGSDKGFTIIQASTKPEVIQYFNTAYSLIPFLKYQNFMGKGLSFVKLYDFGNFYLVHVDNPDYNELILNGLNYLISNKRQANNAGLSIAAYAHAIAGNSSIAREFLEDVEQYSRDDGDNMKCFKINRHDESCDMQHTAYVALTYLNLNEISKAKKLVAWLVNELNRFYELSTTHDYAVAVEAVAKLANHLKLDENDFTVTLKDEFSFEKEIDINSGVADTRQIINMPKYSQSVTSTARGHGFCSIITIAEKVINLSSLNPKFNIDIKSFESSSRRKESTVRVCVKYTSKYFTELASVIYEIEMPSGYIYEAIEDKDNLIKLVEKKREGTLVFLYFDRFEATKDVCVDVKILKAFEIREIKEAGVKVYNNHNKGETAISFYKLDSSQCGSGSINIMDY